MTGKSLLLFLLLAALGCSTPAPSKKAATCGGQILNEVCTEVPEKSEILGKACKSHLECLNQAACIEGTCQVECIDTWHCTAPLVCDHFRCLTPAAPADVVDPPDVPDAVAPEDTGPEDVAVAPDLPDAGDTPCTFHIDCGGTAACIDGTCQVQCLSDSDCGDPDLFDCKQFQCFAAAVPDAGPTDPGAPPVDEGPAPADIGPELPPNCTAKKSDYGATCFCKQDCASDLCLGDIAAGKGFCTEECFTSDNCPGTAWCYDAGDAKVCVKNDSGAPCSGGCLSGITLQNQAGKCICTAPCESAKQCPGDMACSTVKGVASKICVPVGDICQGNGAGSPCFGMCWPDLQNNLFCSATCTKLTDCPAGMTCFNDVELGAVVCMPK